LAVPPIFEFGGLNIKVFINYIVRAAVERSLRVAKTSHENVEGSGDITPRIPNLDKKVRF